MIGESELVGHIMRKRLLYALAQNHRVIEAGKGLQDHSVQYVTNPHFVNQTRALNATSNHSLNSSRDGDSLS